MKKILYIFLVFFLSSCKFNSTESEEDNVFKYQGYLLAAQPDLIDRQFFSIPNTDTIIIGLKGVMLEIPRNSFIDKNRRFAEHVNIELVELNSVADFVITNLSTVSNQGILQSGGMIFIDAKDSKGKQLYLADEASITVSIPTSNYDPLMKVYQPDDRAKKLEWVKVNDTLYPELITIPLIDEKMTNFFKYLDTVGYKKIIDQSYISTWQFMYSNRPNININHAGINGPLMYLNGVLSGRDLWEIDSILYNENVEKYIEIYHKHPIEGNNIYNDDWRDFYIIPLKKYYSQKLTKPEIIETYNVDLNGENAYFELLEKGLSPTMASKAILNQQKSNIILQNLNNEQQTYYTFKSSNLGFINVDRLINEENFIAADIKLKVVNFNKFGHANTYLIMKERKSVIEGIQSGGYFEFTQDIPGYNNKLPKDEEVMILALVYYEDKIWFDTANIRISTAEQIELTLKESTIQDLMLALD